MTTKYAVVPSSGCYGSGSTVQALSVHSDRGVALSRAQAATRSYRREMQSVGGSSGGYRVVTTEARTRRDTSWLGHELDREPSIR